MWMVYQVIWELDVFAQAYDPGTWKAEAGWSQV